MVTIEESGMIFGEYKDENVFYIEKSSQYTKCLKPNGIKSCEFILKRDNSLIFIEAKTSCPRQIAANSPEEKIEKYNQYISDILVKMHDSLSLYASILLKQYSQDNIPAPLLENDLSNKKIKLILVVKKAELEWLIPLSEKLNATFSKELRIWKIDRIIVINEVIAKERRLVI